MTVQTRPRMSDEPGVRFGIANGVLVLTLLAAAVSRLGLTRTELLVILVAGVASCGLSARMTTSIGVVAWALVTGFVEHSYGQLTFGAADLERLALFAIATLALAAFVHRTYFVISENAHE
jgi:hypothetical protein